MIEQNIENLTLEIEKLSQIEIKRYEQAHTLSSLFNARNCLVNLLNEKEGNDKDKSKAERTEENSGEIRELNDILPALKEYQQAKTDFRGHKITQDGVNHYLRRLVVEINEFLVLLHSNTTSEEEREILNGIKIL